MQLKEVVESKTAIVAEACRVAFESGVDQAASVLRDQYPFVPIQASTRKYGLAAYTRVFARDGFLDRYSGARLIFPPVLRTLSVLLPSEFPYHPHWKTDSTHPAYWDLGATIDHLIPVTRGGVDAETNWVTTSMVLNSAKLNWTLDELGWSLHPPGILDEWDGLMKWFVQLGDRNPGVLATGSLCKWHTAAKLVLAEFAAV